MKIYNTLGRKIVDFKPQNTPRVTVYTCGPTVYDYAHIGHWFTYVRADILIRTLKSAGYELQWIMNITDVGHLVSDGDDGEDKLEKGARREGKTAWEVAEFYTKDFLDGMTQLNITTPTNIVRATDYIEDQIDLIRRLESNSYTYKIDDGIYYDTSKFSSYGELANLDLEKLQEGARVKANTQKLNPADFALWKFSPKSSKRDMEWPSPWGIGFPGWHIECSAMSMKHLGDTLDIHTGGIDHIPVHHTNEIAQSEGATTKKFVNYWFHSNHVLIDGQKIAKSLGNGIRLDELKSRSVPMSALRLLILESHYRTQSLFSWESLQAAHNRLQGFYDMSDLRFQPQSEGLADVAAIKSVRAEMQLSLEQDLNTPIALAKLSQFTASLTNGVAKPVHEVFFVFLKWLDDVLGLQLSESVDISELQKEQITKRQDAKKAGDWETADSIRNQLNNDGIVLRDIKNSTLWSRKV